MQLSTQQREAIDRAIRWHAERPDEPFRLFGYAGTGKTSIARRIAESLGTKTLYAAYTGKAVDVLRSKGCEPVSTIHSLIYIPKEHARAKLRALKQRLEGEESKPVAEQDTAKLLELRREIQQEEDRLSSPSFTLRLPSESRIRESGLVIIDECSMVPDDMASDLRSFGAPLLVLGDPMQLPPVRGEGGLINAAPDHLLTEIHRSALDSPVTRIATAIRRASPGDGRYGVPGMDANCGRTKDIRPEHLLWFDQILCGTNATRWQAIACVRWLEGRSPGDVSTGDRIIVLANNGELEVFNGQQFTVESAVYDPEGDAYELWVRDDSGDSRELVAAASGFRGVDGERQARLIGRSGPVAAATYAQAITVHKAQGSQWPRVLVLDESHVFARMASGGPSEAFLAGQRWLYTAATRAQSQLIIASPNIVR